MARAAIGELAVELRADAVDPQLKSTDLARIYFAGIGGAIFSAGAGGNTGVAPAFWASASGRAGCGGISDGRAPVVAGSEGAAGLLSAPGVDCSGGVACAILISAGASFASDAAEMPSPAITITPASSRSVRQERLSEDGVMAATSVVSGGQRTLVAKVPKA